MRPFQGDERNRTAVRDFADRCLSHSTTSPFLNTKKRVSSRPNRKYPPVHLKRKTGFGPATLGLGSRCSTAELFPQLCTTSITKVLCYLVELRRLELLTSCVQGKRSTNWATTPISKFNYLTSWAFVDSNHRPHPYQGCALTAWAKGPWEIFHFPLTWRSISQIK